VLRIFPTTANFCIVEIVVERLKTKQVFNDEKLLQNLGEAGVVRLLVNKNLMLLRLWLLPK